MIIQTQAEERPDGARFAITLDEHLQLVSQFAENYGNDDFAQPEPRDYFLYACRWHDKGWKDLDDNPPLDPKTGLPYNLVETPIPIITLTGCRSPEYNEAHHAYCGLLDSMHIWGLYNGRYGMSDKVLIDIVPEQHRLAADTMLNTERQRQERLTAVLQDDPETAPWVEHERLFANYKALQFFDTFALYFNCVHAGGAWGEHLRQRAARRGRRCRYRGPGARRRRLQPRSLSLPRRRSGSLVHRPPSHTVRRRRRSPTWRR